MELIPSDTLARTGEELSMVQELMNQFAHNQREDELNWRYYNGTRRLEWLGISVPPQMDQFQLFTSWPEVVVEAIVERSDVKSLMFPEEVNADKRLMELFDYNNLAAEMVLHKRDKLIYGRSVFSVGTNERDRDYPLIRVESPREVVWSVNPRTQTMDAALRVYGVKDGQATLATLYTPEYTLWIAQQNGRWRVTDRDDHRLGVVPLVSVLNRRTTGDQHGRSEMGRVIPFTDACARTLTNMQVAVEVLATPQRWAIGLEKEDFMDADGNMLPAWEVYLGQILVSVNKDAKMGQFPAADLSNFHETVKLYGQLAASATGYPAKYFGNFTANPPAEGAIKAEEARLVKTVERSNSESGTGLGWTLALAERFRTGEWPVGSRIKVEWHDPATPTVAQRADAVQKLAGGRQILSREGAWDELGWSEARKDRERDYIKKEQRDINEAITTADFEM